MIKRDVLLVILVLFSLTACEAASTPTAVVSPASPAPSTSPQAGHEPVLIGYKQNPATITLFKTDGSVIKTMPGYPVGDERAIGAYLVMTKEAGGDESTVDADGVIKPVAPAAAKVLTPATPGYPIIVDHTTAIVGCARTSAEAQDNSACTAEVVNMATGEIRPLLVVPGTGAASMQLGLSLTLLDISADLNTVWLRRITDASTGHADVVGIDLRTTAVKPYSLPVTLMPSQVLAISRDGTMVAGQEDAGTDPNRITVQHLHVASLLTGDEADVQGTAPYVAGGRPPQILFAPDGSAVAWWGSLNGAFNSGRGDRLNVASTGRAGKTVWLDGSEDLHVTGVSWLDRTTLIAQDETDTVTIDVTTGAVERLKANFPYLLAVLV